MSTRLKFLPVLALAVAFGPFAAQARSTVAPVQDPAHQIFLVGEYASTQQAPRGRASEANVPAGLYAVDAQAQYAAINALPQEN
jgi:hypothetical protein